jgi:hypothetical protein
MFLRRFLIRPSLTRRMHSVLLCRGGVKVVFVLLWLLTALSPAPRAAEPAPVSTDELERLVNTLRDDASRDKLVEQLRGLIVAQRAVEKEKPAGAAFFNQVTRQVEAFSGEILAGAAMVVDAPRLLEWASQEASDTAARRLWAEAAFAFVLIFGSAALAELAFRTIIARLLPRLPMRRSDTRGTRLFRAAGSDSGRSADRGFCGHSVYCTAGGHWTPDARSHHFDGAGERDCSGPSFTLRRQVDPVAGRRRRGVFADRPRDPKLSIYLDQAIYFLGDFWIRGF